MKKIVSLFLIVFFSIGLTTAQNNDAEIKSLQKKIDKSQVQIDNPKQNIKYQTWAKRGKLFIDAYSVNTKFLAVGIAANTLPFVKKSQDDPTPFYGNPKKTYFEGDFEIWGYDKIKIFILDGYVQKWEETTIPFPNALIESYTAYKKAIELDDKGKFVAKKSTMQEISMLRNNLLNASITAHQEDDYVLALSLIEKSIDLYQYPKEESDTIIQFGVYNYYAGIFAFNTLKSISDTSLSNNEIQENMQYNSTIYDKSINYFKASIEEEFEIGFSYQYITEVMFRKDDTINAVTFLENGADKYPQEPKIIYTLIDYYSPRGEYDKAFEYIDKAIAMTPDVGILYIVKGDSYAKIFYNFQEKYFNLLAEADSLDKLAFQNRTNTTKQQEFTNAKNLILNDEIPPLETQMNDYAQKTLASYLLAVDKEPTNADHLYKISDFYYRRSKLNAQIASGLRKLKTVIAKLDADAVEYMNKAKEYGEASFKLNETDFYTLDLLKRIYFGLQMYDESNDMKRRIGEL